jgi:hypothetical protein
MTEPSDARLSNSDGLSEFDKRASDTWCPVTQTIATQCIFTDREDDECGESNTEDTPAKDDWDARGLLRL